MSPAKSCHFTRDGARIASHTSWLSEQMMSFQLGPHVPSQARPSRVSLQSDRRVGQHWILSAKGEFRCTKPVLFITLMPDGDNSAIILYNLTQKL